MARALEFLQELLRLKRQQGVNDDYKRLQDEVLAEFGSAEEFQQALNDERAASPADVSDAISAEPGSSRAKEAERALLRGREAERALLEGLEAEGASSE